MTFACAASPAGALRALVASADCNSRHYAQAGYAALTSAQSFFPAALTVVLVIMVGLIGFRLMLGLGAIRINELPVLALKVGAVLALTMQWPLFQTLVFDLAYDAPLQVAAATLRGNAAASGMDPLGDAQAAYDQLQQSGAAIGRLNAASAATSVQSQAAEDLVHAARTLLMTSAGALSAAFVAIGIFTALGPLFLAAMLLAATADLFLGWLRAMVAAAFAPMLIWGNMALLTAMLRPDLAALQAQTQSGTFDLSTVDQIVTLVQLFAVTQVALIALGVAAALGLGFGRKRAASADRAPRVQSAFPGPSYQPRSEQLAERLRSSSLQRSAPVGSGAAGRTVSLTDMRSPLQRPEARRIPDDHAGGGARRSRVRNRPSSRSGRR